MCCFCLFSMGGSPHVDQELYFRRRIIFGTYLFCRHCHDECCNGRKKQNFNVQREGKMYILHPYVLPEYPDFVCLYSGCGAGHRHCNSKFCRTRVVWSGGGVFWPHWNQQMSHATPQMGWRAVGTMACLAFAHMRSYGPVLAHMVVHGTDRVSWGWVRMMTFLAYMWDAKELLRCCTTSKIKAFGWHGKHVPQTQVTTPHTSRNKKNICTAMIFVVDI